MALTKNDLVNLLYEKLGLPKNECVSLVESVFEIMKAELAAGNDLLFSGFGKWSVKEKHARQGRNPKTGETLTISARRVVVFKASGRLRGQVKGDKETAQESRIQ